MLVAQVVSRQKDNTKLHHEMVHQAQQMKKLSASGQPSAIKPVGNQDTEG